ncbi:MAG: serine hydrolase domain-containing protein [Planctomycetota bacterium]|jgi:CubicO group peptidase (beta-lactamase class C family)
MRRIPILVILFACLVPCLTAFAWEVSDSPRMGPVPAESLNPVPWLQLPHATEESLEETILAIMDKKHIPGLSASVMKKGRIIWQKALGYACFDPQQLVEEDTLFMLASVSKTVTAAALMQLYEKELFELHDPVNDYLSFSVIHPDFPGTDISFHMLLTHTSGINDNWSVMPYYPGDSPIPLGDYLHDYFTPGGAFYDPDKNFTGFEPGTQFVYSNIGIALAGYLVEAMTGIPLEDYCQENLFEPLGMEETSFFLANLDPQNIAMPCHWNGSSYDPYGHFGYNEYPAGQLRTSAPQLMRFLSVFMGSLNHHEPWQGGGQGGGFPSGGLIGGPLSPQFFSSNGSPGKVPQILERATVEMMLTPQVPDIFPYIGLVWFKTVNGNHTYWGHTGGDKGVRTGMRYYLEEEIGVIALTNGEASTGSILDAMFDYALDL